MRRLLPTLVLRFGVTRDEGGIHRLLVIVIVRQRSMNLGRRQVWIVHHDLRGTLAMRNMIRDNVDYPVPGSVYAGSPLRVEGDVGISHVLILLLFHVDSVSPL